MNADAVAAFLGSGFDCAKSGGRDRVIAPLDSHSCLIAFAAWVCPTGCYYILDLIPARRSAAADNCHFAAAERAVVEEGVKMCSRLGGTYSAVYSAVAALARVYQVDIDAYSYSAAVEEGSGCKADTVAAAAVSAVVAAVATEVFAALLVFPPMMSRAVVRRRLDMEGDCLARDSTGFDLAAVVTVEVGGFAVVVVLAPGLREVAGWWMGCSSRLLPSRLSYLFVCCVTSLGMLLSRF